MHTSTTLASGKVLVFGGITQNGGVDGNTWIYDPSTGTWEMKSPFPDMFRYAQSAVSTGGNAYVFGGMGPDGASDKMWKYNSETEQWVVVDRNSNNSKDHPTGRYHHAMVVSEEHNKIWILGGSTTFDDELSDVWEYDIIQNSWSQLEDLPMPRTKFAAALSIEDNQQGEIVIFGGVSNNIVIEESYTYPLTITDVSELSQSFKLFENYPNPFSETTVIEFQLSSPSPVTLDVYNQLGEKVTCLLNEKKNLGNHKVIFDASELPMGIYFIKLQMGSNSQINKCVLLK
jgi:N-acetylneuraminic acid mutarotase